METLPEPQDQIKSLLSWFMSDEDVARYSDVECALETLKTDELCWQAAVSIGVHAIVFGHFGETDEEKALVKNLAGYALEPMEALHQSLTAQARQQPLTDEQARMLFHLRFALGFLLQFGKGDAQRALGFLHEMAGTQLCRFAGGVRSGGDTVTYTDDMRRGKDFAARLMSTLCAEMDNYEETLSVITRAAGMTGDPLGLLGQVADLLDRWAAKCEAIEQREGADELDAFLEWTPLLYSAAEVVSVGQQVDTSGVLPGECDKASPQFLAYKLGQLAARFAANNADFSHHFLDEVEEEPGRFDFLVEALLCDHEPGRDWQKVRDRYLAGWRRTPCYEGTSPEEIGPHMDLYWAMRIGFADKILESTQAVVPAGQPAAPPDVVRDIETIKEVVTTIAIRQVKQERDLNERLPPAKRQIHGFLAQCLPGVSDQLPPKVINALTKAEGYYKSEVNDEEAKVSFVKAVEAALYDCWVAPLADFMERDRRQQIDLPLPLPRNRMGATRLRRLSLLDCADLFDTLVTPARRDLSALGAEDLRHFMNQRIGPRWPDFGPLAQSLRRVQELRAASAHYQQAETRVDRELWELEEIRKLVLGTAGSPSVIVQIYRLLAPSKQS
jgi:hypothetical protein